MGAVTLLWIACVFSLLMLDSLVLTNALLSKQWDWPASWDTHQMKFLLAAFFGVMALILVQGIRKLPTAKLIAVYDHEFRLYGHLVFAIILLFLVSIILVFLAWREHNGSAPTLILSVKPWAFIFVTGSCLPFAAWFWHDARETSRMIAQRNFSVRDEHGILGSILCLSPLSRPRFEKNKVDIS